MRYLLLFLLFVLAGCSEKAPPGSAQRPVVKSIIHYDSAAAKLEYSDGSKWLPIADTLPQYTVIWRGEPRRNDLWGRPNAAYIRRDDQEFHCPPGDTATAPRVAGLCVLQSDSIYVFTGSHWIRVR